MFDNNIVICKAHKVSSNAESEAPFDWQSVLYELKWSENKIDFSEINCRTCISVNSSL